MVSDTLIQKLRKSGIGCHIGSTYLGAFGYADDVTLLAPTREGLQLMLNLCEEFASTHSMLFSTDSNPNKSKTKCLFFSKSRTVDAIECVRLNGNDLPWVSSAKHLGNQLSSKIMLSPLSPDTSADILCKRALFFNSVHQVIQRFGSYDPSLTLKLVSVYSTAMYGSSLWKLDSEEHHKLCRSWNTAVKIVWDLPHATHSRFLEDLCPVPHLEQMLYARYIGFAHSLAKSGKNLLRLLFEISSLNLNTVTGQNISYLKKKFQCNNFAFLCDSKLRIRNSRVYPLKDEEKWKIELIKELGRFRKHLVDIDLDEDQLNFILDQVCLE